tara:strand:- start:1072 stop:2877 length:1806 start_codon:yes stop_codon:yes gene_type:complete
MNVLKIKSLFIFISIFTQLVFNLNSIAEGNKNDDNSKIIWKKIKRNYIHNYKNQIEWEKYDGALDLDIKREYPKKVNIYTQKNIYQELTEIEPYLPLNYFLKPGEITTSIKWKSAFSGGVGGGTGHQNISAKIDYGLYKNSLLSLYLSETDDPLFNLINDEKIANNWASIALSYKRKIFETKDKNQSLSFSSSLEYWVVSSGSNDSKSIFNEVNNDKGLDRHQEIIYSFSIPYENHVNNRTTFVITPGITFLPKILGEKNIGDNFYGNNVYLASGLQFRFSDTIKLNGSYSYLFGPGNNYFDKNLNFSRKPIYSYGLNWDLNPILGLEAKITNAYGSTPATGLLTIPSDNKPLYFLSGTYKPYQNDTGLRPIEEEDKSLIHGGITVSNALIPERGKSQVSLNYDSNQNLFGSYKYSLSNLFQLELINLGSYKDINYNSTKNSEIRKIFLDNDNLNYRLGGKFLLLSPQKDDPFWLSSRISLGRNDSTKKGYVFSDLTSTFKLTNWWAFNISPKYLFSGVDNLGSLGFSSNINFLNNLNFISEINIGVTDKAESNSTIAFRYSYDSAKSLDLYLTNAVGLSDIGQMLKSDDYKFGVKLNFIF